MRKKQGGFSILEILIAAGLLSIISLGIATMLESMSVEQKRVRLFLTLQNLRTDVKAVVKDQNAWANTVNNAGNDVANPDWPCLRNTTTCTVPATPQKVILSDAAGNVAYDLLGWNDTTGNGFSETGARCTTFSSVLGSGSDDCPISYRLVYSMACTGAVASCTNPQIRITGRLLYNPATTGTLEKYRRMIAVGNLAGAGTSPAAGITGIDEDADDQKYDISIQRTASMLNRSFNLAAAIVANPGPAGCNVGTNVAGQCNQVNALTNTTALSPAGAQHPKGFNIADDPFSMVTLADAGRSVIFKEKGYYSCSVSVVGFATSGFQAGLVNKSTGALIGSGGTIAGLWSQSTAVFESKFNVTDVTHQYVITQKCENNAPGGTPAADNCTLGMNTSPYTGQTAVVSMACYRIDQVN